MSSRELKEGKSLSRCQWRATYKNSSGSRCGKPIVNENNPISKLSLKDIERIFTDDVTDWSSVGGKSGKISAYTRNTSSGTYAFFQKFALASRDYGNSTQKMAGNEQIATEVANNVNGIGYIGLAYDGSKGIKV